jgi:hypothetical protein
MQAMRRKTGVSPQHGVTVSYAARSAPLPFFDGLQFVAESAVVAPFEPALFALTFAGFYQVFQTTRPLDRCLTTLRAPFVPLHAQLIFSLARNSQRRELVFNAFSHFIPFPTGKNISRNNLYITLDRSRPILFDCQTFWLKKAQNVPVQCSFKALSAVFVDSRALDGWRLTCKTPGRRWSR